MAKIKLSELRQWQWYCGQQNKCCECEKSSDCFDVFGANKVKDYDYVDGVIKKIRK